MFERRIVATKAEPASGYEQAHEIVRFLASQQLPPTPANYTLGHIALTNPPGLAARAVDAVVMTGQRLSQMQADTILAAYGPRPGNSLDTSDDHPDRAAIRHQALRLAELAAGTVESTGRFQRELAEEQDSLGRDGVAIAHIVTAMMERSTLAERALTDAAREIESLRLEVEAARSDAARDALTGLDNRRGIDARVAAIEDKNNVVVAMCDIDRFKSVNDRYGHVVGDRVLKLVATSLAESCAPHAVARWGGEEFLVLIQGLSVADAAALIDTARTDLAGRHVRLRTTDEPLGTITFSAGIAPLTGRKLTQAIHDADMLVYRAKEGGRDRVLVG